MSDYKEIEWTICFHFPIEDVYPSKNGSFQKELDECVRVWTDKKEAKAYAESQCGKYAWTLMPTVIETKVY